MFALSDARENSFPQVPYLEREEKITDQSNFVNLVEPGKTCKLGLLPFWQFLFRWDGRQMLKRKRHFVGFGELALVFSVSSSLLNFLGLFTLLTLSTRSFLLGMVAVLGKIGLPPGPKPTLWNLIFIIYGPCCHIWATFRLRESHATRVSKYGQNEYLRALNASYTFQLLMGFCWGLINC